MFGIGGPYDDAREGPPLTGGPAPSPTAPPREISTTTKQRGSRVPGLRHPGLGKYIRMESTIGHTLNMLCHDTLPPRVLPLGLRTTNPSGARLVRIRSNVAAGRGAEGVVGGDSARGTTPLKLSLPPLPDMRAHNLSRPTHGTPRGNVAGSSGIMPEGGPRAPARVPHHWRTPARRVVRGDQTRDQEEDQARGTPRSGRKRLPLPARTWDPADRASPRSHRRGAGGRGACRMNRATHVTP